MKRSSISRKTTQSVDSVVLSYLKSLDTPVSLGVWLRYKYSQSDLLTMQINPLDYNDRIAFHKDYLAVKFLSKYDGLDVNVDRRAAAIEAFYSFEEQCAMSNARIEKRVFPKGNAGTVIYRAREKIRRLLGPCDSTALEKIFSKCQFGPGTTSSCKGRWLSPYEKMSSDGHTTTALHRLLSRSLRPSDYPSWSAIHSRVPVLGNSVATVPKNSKTERTIAVEPHINAFFQRGVGVFFRSRLRRWGISLQDQTRNQELARRGSINNILATIDLKGASDTISIECVRLLLPDQWWLFLEHLRSPVYSLGSEKKRYEKHSSMGNGYTFELESLIFAAVCASVRDVLGDENEWSVYGDDIIIASACVPLLLETMAYLGFSPNTEKSFSSTYFRESCGADWWDGVEVTPFYLRRKGDIVQLITFANWLRTECPSFVPIAETWKKLFFLVPRSWSNKGPSGGPGIYFYVNEVECDICWFHPPKPFRFGEVGWRLRTMDFRPATRKPPDGESTFCGSLYGGYHYRACSEWVPSLKASFYSRVSTAKEAGRWKSRSYVFNDIWPRVRSLYSY